MTEWRDIEGFPGYQVSSDGRVRSQPRRIVRPRNGRMEAAHLSGRELAQCLNPKGYLTVTLYRNGEKFPGTPVHRLVAMAFVPNPDGLPWVNHKHEDGDKTRNNDWNLEWTTPSGNNAHARRVLGLCRGEQHVRAKITEDMVRTIRADPRSTRKIAADYPLSKTQIHLIKSGRNWSHVS